MLRLSASVTVTVISIILSFLSFLNAAPVVFAPPPSLQLTKTAWLHKVCGYLRTQNSSLLISVRESCSPVAAADFQFKWETF